MRARASLALLAAAATLAAGCLAATPAPSPSLAAFEPPRDAAPLGLSPVASAPAPGGYAMRVHEDRAYVATFDTQEGISIFDVSDPLAPAHLGGIVGVLARSVDVLDYGARTAIALSTGTELEVWDVTDPAAPARLAQISFGSHNVQVVPGANVIYNARNVWDGAGGAMEIVDASDPANVHLASTFTFPPLAEDGSPIANQGCHDFTIWPDEERAYCAAYQQTLILDIADPLAPKVLTAITNHAIWTHHTAFPILDHTALVIGDEALDNLAWGCAPETPSPAREVVAQAPLGTLWFYDLTTSPPALLSWLAAPPADPEPAVIAEVFAPFCTAHNGSESPTAPGLLAYGWFRAGLTLVDASDPSEPVLLDVEDVGGAVGDARWHDGYVLAADDEVGLTVLEVA